MHVSIIFFLCYCLFDMAFVLHECLCMCIFYVCASKDVYIIFALYVIFYSYNICIIVDGMIFLLGVKKKCHGANSFRKGSGVCIECNIRGFCLNH